MALAIPRTIKGKKIAAIPISAKGSFQGLTPLRSASLVQYLQRKIEREGRVRAGAAKWRARQTKQRADKETHSSGSSSRLKTLRSPPGPAMRGNRGIA